MTQIPEDAVKITFAPLNKDPMPYYIWQRQGKWYWQALAQSGIEPTEQGARDAAKRWISEV